MANETFGVESAEFFDTFGARLEELERITKERADKGMRVSEKQAIEMAQRANALQRQITRLLQGLELDKEHKA